MKRLEGKVALVTGAARGIGYGIATKLAENGATVVICDIMEDVVAESAKQLAAETGAKVDYVVANVADSASVDAMIATVIERHGQLHILVNNAGINRDGMLHKMTNENWDAVIAVDLSSVFYCTRAAANHMREKGYGRIVNIASIVGEASLRNQCAFNAAKAGVINMTKSMAMELAKHEINVNCICPGSIMFEGTRKIFYKDPVSAEKMMSHIPQHRAGDPEDIAGMTIMLSSDKIKYMTGDIVTIDGGWIAGYSCDGLE